MKFSQQCREESDSLWQASFRHPFVTRLADGTLPLECFRFYVQQDSYYLSQFARIQALGAFKADNLLTASRMAAHVQGTYQAELSLHERFSSLLGITDEERKGFEPAPTAYAYTSHLHRAAQAGGLADVVSAILPCYWLYWEIGQRFRGSTPEEPVYREWISAYGQDWFRDLVEEQITRLDTLAEEATESHRSLLRKNFLISSRYELMFWEMAYTLEHWPR